MRTFYCLLAATIVVLFVMYQVLPLLVLLSLFFQGTTRLHEAAERGDVEAVQNLITCSTDINSRAEDVRLYN